MGMSMIKAEELKVWDQPGPPSKLEPSMSFIGILCFKRKKKIKARLWHIFSSYRQPFFLVNMYQSKSWKVNIIFCLYNNVSDYCTVRSFRFLMFSLWNKEIEANGCFLFLYSQKNWKVTWMWGRVETSLNWDWSLWIKSELNTQSSAWPLYPTFHFKNRAQSISHPHFFQFWNCDPY